MHIAKDFGCAKMASKFYWLSYFQQGSLYALTLRNLLAIWCMSDIFCNTLMATCMCRWLHPEEEDAASDRPLSSSIVQRLQRFGTYGRLKQAALRKVAHNLAADDAALMDLQKAFAKMDPEGTGSIRYSSLSQVDQHKLGHGLKGLCRKNPHPGLTKVHCFHQTSLLNFLKSSSKTPSPRLFEGHLPHLQSISSPLGTGPLASRVPALHCMSVEDFINMDAGPWACF